MYNILVTKYYRSYNHHKQCATNRSTIIGRDHPLCSPWPPRLRVIHFITYDKQYGVPKCHLVAVPPIRYSYLTTRHGVYIL